MYDKPVQTDVATADKAITDEPTILYWAMLEPATLGAKGTLKIRDGHSTSDKEVARIVTGDGRPFNFYPPIRLASGLYCDIDAAVTSYTVGYLFERIVKGERG